MKYLAIDGRLLENKTIGSTDKLIIAFISNLEKGGKAFYGTHIYMSEVLGIRYEYFEKRFTKLLQVGVLYASDDGIRLKYGLDATADMEWKLA